MDDWFDETLYPDYRQRIRIGRVIHRTRTAHQDLVVLETAAFGRVLALDGVVQLTERDEFAYHEMLAHVPLVAHGAARRVLIIGGGDGGTLREVLKHDDVEQATLVEIDAGVIDLCREHLPAIAGGAFDDPRAEIVIADGTRFVAETDRRFDVIISDSTDPLGPAEVLFAPPFYADCRRRLAPGGVLVTQNGVPFMQGDELRNSVRALRPLFADVSCYLVPVPTYVGGFMALGWAGLDAATRETPPEEIARRYAARRLETRYYNPDVHAAAFALPNFVRALLD
jgi:spermidine synthase